MTYKQYLNEMTKIIKEEPEFAFKSTIEDFAKKLAEKNKEYVTKLTDGLKDRAEKEKNPIKRKRLQDAYSNQMLMIGNHDNISAYDSYDNSYGLLLNWHLSTSLYMSSWVFAKVINRPSTDMIRNGWKTKFDQKKVYNIIKEDGKLYREDVTEELDIALYYKRQRQFIPKLIQATKWARLYGGAVACLVDSTITDDAEYEKPLESIDPNAELDLIVVDRWQVVNSLSEMVDDVGSLDFNTPKFYNVRTNDGRYIRFHHSRVARFSNGEAPYLINQVLQGWGIPEIVRIYNEITRDEKIKNSITSLLNKQNLEIIQTAGMRAFMNGELSPEMEKMLDSKLEAINRYRHFNSLVFLDKDDQYTRLEGNVGNLYQLIDTESRLVAGAAEMPQVLLYGDQQMGLSGDSHDDLRLYEDNLMSKREETLGRPINKVTDWLIMWLGFEVEDYSNKFNSSLQETPEQRMERAREYINMYRDLESLGIYTPYMIAKEIRDMDDFPLGAEIDDEVLRRLDEKHNMLEEVELGESDINITTEPEGKGNEDLLYNENIDTSDDGEGDSFEDLPGTGGGEAL